MEHSRFRSFFCGAFCLFGVLFPAKLFAAEQTLSVDFSEARLVIVSADGSERFSTAVVLPRRNFYPVPVQGTVRRAEMGPTWIPTRRMHEDQPGRFRASYGPFAPGNAMGHCRVKINFDSTHPMLRYVRVHGNARETDLGKRLSRGCIRIPDNRCQELVDTLAGHVTAVRFEP